jgi:hypothetical protein
LKLWCKWDLEGGLYQNFLKGKVWDEMRDQKWFPQGVPLVFVAMHNTKEVVESDTTLMKIMTNGASENYLYFGKKYFANETEFRKHVSMDDKPCLLV